MNQYKVLKAYFFAIGLISLTSLHVFAQDKKTKPDSLIVTPFFPITTKYALDSNAVKNIKKISIDVEVKTDIPEGYHYCISALNSDFNGKSFHTGLASYTNGIPVNIKNAKDTVFGQGAVFTRWAEDNPQLVKTNGFTERHATSYISIRNKASWNKGKYRITLYKSGYKKGKPIPSQNLDWKEQYPLTVYEHSWMTMKVKNLETGKKWVIGSVAFPGKKIDMKPQIYIFLEQYGPAINYGAKNRKLDIPSIYYKNIPKVQLVIDNITINGKKQYLQKVIVKKDMPKAFSTKEIFNDTKDGILFETEGKQEPIN